MLILDPSKRINALESLRHPFFQCYNIMSFYCCPVINKTLSNSKSKNETEETKKENAELSVSASRYAAMRQNNRISSGSISKERKTVRNNTNIANSTNNQITNVTNNFTNSSPAVNYNLSNFIYSRKGSQQILEDSTNIYPNKNFKDKAKASDNNITKSAKYKFDSILNFKN